MASKQYTSGTIGLDLDGKFVGFVESAAGGEPYAEVIVEPVGEDGVARKHVGVVKYEPIVLEVGLDLGATFYDWISETLAGSSKPRNGRVRFFDYTRVERDSLEFSDALITQIALPQLDARSKEQSHLTVTIAPTRTRRSVPAAAAAPTAKKSTKLAACNFAVEINRLESASKFVAAVAAIVVACGPPVDIPIITITVAGAHAGDFRKWFDDFVIHGLNTDADERFAKIELRDASLKNTLVTFELDHVGVVRIAEANETTGKTTVSQVEVELYCESLRVKLPTITPQPGPQPDAGSGQTISGTLSASEIAERLVASRTKPGKASTGAKWAEQEASLDELAAIVALDGQEWSAVTLPEDHTLLRALRAAGYVDQTAGPVMLDRDPQIEQIITDAVAVYNQVLPLIIERESATASEIISNLK